MQKIQLWSVDRGENTVSASPVETVDNAETEHDLEDLLVASPDLLMSELTLIGRQVPTGGGPLDLLGVDSEGRLVVFELKRGTLTRDAVAQVLDYTSYLAGLDEDRFARLIEEHSGQLGIDTIDDFGDWYRQEYPNQSESVLDRPKMILVGLGVDDRARRVVDFLADSRVDIQLLTFHAFRSDEKLLLARQIESRSPKPPRKTAPPKAVNLKMLLDTATSLGVKGLLAEVGGFIEHRIPAAYCYPNKLAYSYYLQERTAAGTMSLRAYVALRLNTKEPGTLTLTLRPRAAMAAGATAEEFCRTFPAVVKDKKQEGTIQLSFGDKEWEALQGPLETLLLAVGDGWKRGSSEAESEQT